MLIIGIDLGASNSAVAVWRDGEQVVIPGQESARLGDHGGVFPSYVALTAGGRLLVGELARRQIAANPEGTLTAFKRRMGRRENVSLRYARFSPEQLSAFLLRKIKHQAEAFLGEPVTGAVISVPACFDDNQRSATRDACRMAGLEVARLINEPTAAALAYGLDRPGEELRIAVVDFGGSSLDVSIVEFGRGVFEVKATSGDAWLGGSDMDQCLFEHLAGRFYEQSGLDVRGDNEAAARLREAVEIARIELSASPSTRVNLPFVAMAAGQQRHLALDLSRAELERVIRPVMERCRVPVEQALRDAKLAPREIDRLLLVGGPTRMPVVRSYFETLFGRPAETGIDPQLCVARGAAIQAGMIAGEIDDIVLVDVTQQTLCIERADGVALPLIARNTPVPVRHTEKFTTTADLQSEITFHVFQGERLMVRDNTGLGEFSLDGLPPAPGGIPKIEVMFDLDASGILEMTARDATNGNAWSIHVSGSTRLSEAEKKRMIRETEKYAEFDKKRRRGITNGVAKKPVKPSRPRALSSRALNGPLD